MNQVLYGVRKNGHHMPTGSVKNKKVISFHQKKGDWGGERLDKIGPGYFSLS